MSRCELGSLIYLSSRGLNNAPSVLCAPAGLTEEAVERMADPYRQPQPAQAAPDLASEEWPDLNGSSVNGNTGGQAGGLGFF